MRNPEGLGRRAFLKTAGFTVEHLYAGFDRSPYGSQYPGELIFVARPSS
jgi:hypothetical protein